MDQHKRTVHIIVENPLFGGATKIVGRPLWPYGADVGNAD